MRNKYLFLKIDGVLDTYRYREILKKYSQHFIDENGLLYDPKVILNLERIIEATDAKIVITSTWRLYDDMKALWHSWGLAGEVVGVTSTYHPRWGKALKRFTCILIPKQGFEVEEWLKGNATEPYNYAILDDKDDKDYFLPHQANHLVLTNPYDGLTKEIADRVIEILLR